MKLRKWWGRNFLQCEFAVGLAATVVVIAWSELFDGASCLNSFLEDRGETIYTVAAPIEAAMLGFILAAAAIIVTAAPSDRLTLLRESDHYDDLWECFRSAMRFLGLGTISTTLGLIITGDNPARFVLLLSIGLTILALLRVARCIWAMNWVIKIFTGPTLEREAGANTQSPV